MILYIVNILMILPLSYVFIEYFKNKRRGEKYTKTTRNILIACALWINQLLFQFPAEWTLFLVSPELSLWYNFVQQMIILLFLNFCIDMSIVEKQITNKNHFKNVTVVSSFLLSLLSIVIAYKFLPEAHVLGLSGATQLQTTGSSAGDALFRIPIIFMLGLIAYTAPNIPPFKILKIGGLVFMVARLIKLLNSVFFLYENVPLNYFSMIISLTGVFIIAAGLIAVVYRKRHKIPA